MLCRALTPGMYPAVGFSPGSRVCVHLQPSRLHSEHALCGADQDTQRLWDLPTAHDMRQHHCPCGQDNGTHRGHPQHGERTHRGSPANGENLENTAEPRHRATRLYPQEEAGCVPQEGTSGWQAASLESSQPGVTAAPRPHLLPPDTTATTQAGSGSTEVARRSSARLWPCKARKEENPFGAESSV